MKERHTECKLIFLTFQTPELLTAKVQERFGELHEEVERRLAHAEHEKSNSRHFDVIIEEDHVVRVAGRVRSYIESQVGYLPQRISEAGPLSDRHISHLLKSGRSGFKIETPPGENSDPEIAGWTIDLTLSTRVYIPRRRLFGRLLRRGLDLATAKADDVQQLFAEKNIVPNRGLRLYAGEFVLASTNEKLTFPDNMAGLLTGRSSYSRLGLSIDFSQNVIQPGHSDVIAIQIKNNLPFDVVLYPGCKIAQVALFRLSGSSGLPYNKDKKSKYLGVNRDLRSKFFDDEFYNSIAASKPAKDTVEAALDFSQIVLGVASLLFGLVSWLAGGSALASVFAGLTIVAVVLFAALLIYKHVRR
jgi:deoxycytidine triphosphate deaminase